MYDIYEIYDTFVIYDIHNVSDIYETQEQLLVCISHIIWGGYD